MYLHTASGTEVQVHQQYHQCTRNEVDFVVAVGNFFSPNEQIGRLGLYVGREGRKMPIPVYFIDNTSESWHLKRLGFRDVPPPTQNLVSKVICDRGMFPKNRFAVGGILCFNSQRDLSCSLKVVQLLFQ